MVINIPEVEPFTFQASTAFDERVQLANKLNEVIDALNLVGDIPDMQTEIDTLKQSVTSLQESIGSTDTNLATVEGNLNKTISDLNALTAKVGTIETTISGIQSDITAIEGDISGLDSEVEGLKAEVVDEVSMASTSHGSVQVTIHHEDGTQDTSAPIDLALVQEGGITLQTGATDRSFNLKVTLSDGSSWQTNDFVIPEGGGTDVSVTSIQISQGTSANQMRVRIGLSDGSFINSNDWTVVTPAEFSTLEGRVTALEGSPGYNLPVATPSVLGGVKIGANITVQADGTISIPNATTSTPGVMTGAQVAQLNTAAVGSTVMFTGDASKVTLHVDSVAGSAFTEDVPAAADGGAGTIDQASYQKLKNIPDPSTIATKEEITGLELSKPNDNQIQLNGNNVDIVENVSAQIVEGSTLRIEVNGVASQANLPPQSTEITGGSFTSARSLYNALENLTINQTITGTFHADDQSESVHIAVSFSIAKISTGNLYPSGMIFAYSVNEPVLFRLITLPADSTVKLSGNQYNGTDWDQVDYTIDSTWKLNGRYFIS